MRSSCTARGPLAACALALPGVVGGAPPSKFDGRGPGNRPRSGCDFGLALNRRSPSCSRGLVHSPPPPPHRIASRGSGLATRRATESSSSSSSALKEMEEVQFAESEALVPAGVANDLVPEALVWAALHGFVVGDRSVASSGTTPGVGMAHVPFSLLPTPIPATAFAQAVELSSLFNDLIDRVSLDVDFLKQALARTQKADDFTARLLSMYSTILDEGVKQDIRLGLSRSDYMLDVATGDLLQVELNTISCSYPGLGSVVSDLHKYLVTELESSTKLDSSRVPENKVTEGFAKALSLAWKEYGNKSAAILMVVQGEEWNMYDQHWLSYRVKELYGIRVIRKTLAQVHAQGSITADGMLVIDGQAVSVVYYRSGYTPADYPSEVEWEARLLMERSSAVKCPSISYHLVGAKKIQQELALPGVLERFVPDKQVAASLRKCFAGLWGLEGAESESIIQTAIKEPHRFVLKPQREGGGNNTYGDDVASKLTELIAAGGDGLAAYILMQRIFPAVHTSYLVRRGAYSAEKTVSELGIFGAYVRNGDRVILNEQSGHLLRTKVSHSNEGGVASGYAVLDSPYLS
ncbi:glutathione synthase [Marchantia polymorpha subsp. ruderalis]|nr:hypothetical protein MARPO_0002s0041 [Marchantia polymorpha]PTQ49539.1 hypothetical protein MARPO_0002s0041 [Marchantia polymorpha]BBN00343.1 hypothetical protein Mp_1g28380 [Marchantia polymorpha subsp. ruderalis]BBN00344.1 hypothetical protein Mp_1g28380 [Marchantia polymorpha subsp. ruderalis]|eukprot:PTQ49538.1 hypothetical protein MARPO_0002s0041 [Marchantia polymorpha]